MARRITTRCIKGNKAYRIDELAETAGVSAATVRNWIKEGMPCLDGHRPTIILGFQALDFLTARKAKVHRPMPTGLFYCFGCKGPREALGAMADFEPTSDKAGRLKALCGICECQCNRNISARTLTDIRKVLDVVNRGNR